MIDSDREFVERLTLHSQNGPVRTHATHSMDDAQELIRDHERMISGVFFSLNLSFSEVLKLIRLVHESRPGTPVFLVYDRNQPMPLSAEDLERLGVQHMLSKPFQYDDMISHVQPKLEIDWEAFAGLPSQQGQQQQQQQFERKVGPLNDDEFFPIQGPMFASGARTFVDLYIQLSPGHYVRVLNPGDRFSSEQLARYFKRGIQRFFARKEDWGRYLTYCDDMLSKLYEDQSATPQERITTTLEFGQSALNFLKEHGVSEAQIQYARQYVAKVEELTKALKVREMPMVRAYLEDMSHYEHSVSCTLLASLLCSSLQIDQHSGTRIVGLGALLHDVGLFQLPPEIQNEEEDLMTPEQRRLYRTHPQLGAELLQKIPGMEKGVIDIVARHHERRNGKGFPPKKPNENRWANTLVEIVGLSDEFARLIARKKDDPSIDPLREMERNVLDGFSRQTAEAFREFFLLTLL